MKAWLNLDDSHKLILSLLERSYCNSLYRDQIGMYVKNIDTKKQELCMYVCLSMYKYDPVWFSYHNKAKMKQLNYNWPK